MKLIVGLGNPGRRYEATRHNVGFLVVDAFARKFRIEVTTHEKESLTGKGQVGGRTIVLAKPQTFMNLSGNAVGRLVRAYIDRLEDLIVIYDEIDLPIGKLRIRPNGSPGTHNGMKSIVASLASDSFPRLRFGIRGESYVEVRDLADYVLDDFSSGEMDVVERSVLRSVDALAIIARGDLARAMNEFNKDLAAEENET
jgi:PTH1 family peptidyl-tRNA hydrolase